MMQETANFIATLNRLADTHNRLPDKVAVVAVNFSKERFRAGNWLGDRTEPWKARKGDKGRKRSGRGILIQSGRLRRSIRKVTANRDYVVIGTDVPYAQAHNEGVRATVKVGSYTYAAKTRLKESYRTRSGNERTRTVTQDHPTTKIEVRAHTRRMRLPRRQFIGASPVLAQQIARFVTAEYIKALRG